jgi:hypothetical protein
MDNYPPQQTTTHRRTSVLNSAKRVSKRLSVDVRQSLYNAANLLAVEEQYDLYRSVPPSIQITDPMPSTPISISDPLGWYLVGQQ